MKKEQEYKNRTEIRLAELQRMQQQLAQQVILAERNLQGLKEQHASCQGAIIELTNLLKK